MWTFNFGYDIRNVDKLEKILTMVYVEHGYLVSGLYPSSSVQCFIAFILLNTGRWIESRNQITIRNVVY
jgi:hypothetical protein